MLDWLFTPQCVACATPATPMCVACQAALVEQGPACPRCAEPSPEGEVAVICRRCEVDPLPMDGVIAPWRFGGPLATAIRRLKFTGHAQIARDLAPLWAPVLAAAVSTHDAVVVPIPLHWRRRLARGYDQSWLLARHACCAAGLAPPVSALSRTRATPPQSTLPAAARRDNLHDVFTARRRAARLIEGRAIILVDDVVTTGATLAAATRALRDAGATTVIGLAIARA